MNINKKDNRWEEIATSIVFFIMIVVGYINNKDISNLFVIYGVYIGFKHLEKYYYNREKSDLIFSIAGVLVAVSSLILWIGKK